MATEYKVLFEAAFVGASQETLFEVGKDTVVTGAIVANVTDTDATLTMYIADTTSAATAAQTIIKDLRVAPGRSVDLWQMANQVIEAGGTVQAQASAANTLTVRVSGVTVG